MKIFNKALLALLLSCSQCYLSAQDRSKAHGYAFSEEELAAALGTGRCSMAAVTDLGFARALMQQLAEEFPGRFDEELETVTFRYEKAKRRKKEKPGVRTKKKTAGED